MTDLILRKASRSDAQKVSDLIHEAMESYRKESGIAHDVLESLSESVESVADRISHNNCVCLFDGNNPVGTITLTYTDNPFKYAFSDKTCRLLGKYSRCAYISRFCVADVLRKTGLGQRLIDHAIRTAFDDGYELILLHTAVANKGMCEFYLNRGFVLADSEKSRGYERGLFALTSESLRNK